MPQRLPSAIHLTPAHAVTVKVVRSLIALQTEQHWCETSRISWPSLVGLHPTGPFSSHAVPVRYLQRGNCTHIPGRVGGTKQANLWKVEVSAHELLVPAAGTCRIFCPPKNLRTCYLHPMCHPTHGISIPSAFPPRHFFYDLHHPPKPPKAHDAM